MLKPGGLRIPYFITGEIIFCADPVVRPAYRLTDVISAALRLFQDVDLVPTVSPWNLPAFHSEPMHSNQPRHRRDND